MTLKTDLGQVTFAVDVRYDPVQGLQGHQRLHGVEQGRLITL